MDDRSETQEGEWVRLARGGDKEAFGKLVRAHMRPAYYVALGLLGNHEDALDASQEAFVRAYLAFAGFDPERPFFAWYYRILKNHCLNVLRKKKRSTRSIADVFTGSAEPGDQASVEELERADLRRAVWEAIWRLGVDDRELIVARDILGTPYATLAELMEVPAGTVMSRLYSARRRLRHELKGALG